jgi:small-conductance mechanosensitive channel/CRP-like cAMP-binding protein
VRLALAAAIFIIVAGLYWVAKNDTAAIMTSLELSWRNDLTVAVGIAFWLCAAWVTTVMVKEAVLRWARRRGAEAKLPRLLIDVGTILVYAAAGLIITSEVFGVSLLGLVATSGVLAAVIGLAVQKTISDVVAGIALNMDQAIKIGDWIQLATVGPGRVTEISWRATRLETIEGRTIIVPNSSLVGNQFTNWNTPQRHFRHSTKLAMGYDVPAERVVAILQAAMEAAEGVLPEPKPTVSIEECGESGIVYGMLYWIADYPQIVAVPRAVTINALKFLDQAGYAPVYPVREVVMSERHTGQIQRRIDVGTILRRAPFFQSFSEPAMAQIEQTVAPRELPAGQTIIRKGDEGNSLFILVAGLLDVIDQREQEQRRVGRLYPGDVFGEMSLLTGAPRQATVMATTPVTVLEICKRDIEPILAENTDFLATLAQLQADRLANNDSVFAIWPEEQQVIRAMGRAAFLRDKVMRFFARSSRERAEARLTQIAGGEGRDRPAAP